MTRRLLIFDATGGPLHTADPWFGIGARFFAGAFDAVVAARTVLDVYGALERHEPSHVQVWGHGAPGAPLIAGNALLATDGAWGACREVWFRSCYVASGLRGQRFMHKLARSCDVVAHLGVIGALGHSYLVGLRAADTPWWDDELAPKSPAPWAPRTVSAFQMRLPPWAYEKKGLP